jgi:hypothetical protein
VDDIYPSKLPEQERPVPELGDDRPQIFDSEEPVQRRGRYRINRHDPGFDPRIPAPAIQHPLRLHRLAAKNPQRGDDDGDSEGRWQGILHMAEVSRR